MEIGLSTVPSSEVDQCWPFVEQHIQRWLDQDGTLTVDEVRDYLRSAKAQLWCFQVDGVIRGIWVTRIEQSARCKWGLVWGCAGDFAPYIDEAIENYRRIEDWFRGVGCEFIEWAGRAGWERLFPGYKRHAVVLRKRL